MSGLAQFFRAFLLPPKPTTDNGGRVDGYSYQTSLEDVEVPQQSSSHSSNHDHDHDHPSFEGEEDSSIEYIPHPLTFKQWRQLQRESLTIYMQKRIAPKSKEFASAEEDDDDESDYYSDVEDSKQQPQQNAEETQGGESDEEAWQTQQQSVEAEQHNEELQYAGRSSVHERRRRIPHVDQATLSVSQLQYIDMYVKELTLSLCRVERVWRLRETKRGRLHSSRAVPIPVFPGRFPRIPFPHKEEDGPLSSCFKSVLSLEVTQVRNHFPPLGTSGNDQRRLRVFLYNSYATALQEWIDRHEQPKFLISFTNVPALCIFPFALDPHNWWEQSKVLNYCLCIGGLSSIKTTSMPSPDRGDYVQVRFDASIQTDVPLEIRAACMPNPERPSDANRKELILSKERLDSGLTLEVSPDLQLFKAYQEWDNNIRQAAGDIAEDVHSSVRWAAPTPIRKEAFAAVHPTEMERSCSLAQGKPTATGDDETGDLNTVGDTSHRQKLGAGSVDQKENEATASPTDGGNVSSFQQSNGDAPGRSKNRRPLEPMVMPPSKRGRHETTILYTRLVSVVLRAFLR